VSAFILSTDNKWQRWTEQPTDRLKAQIGWIGLRVSGYVALGLCSSNEPGYLLPWLWSGCTMSIGLAWLFWWLLLLLLLLSL